MKNQICKRKRILRLGMRRNGSQRSKQRRKVRMAINDIRFDGAPWRPEDDYLLMNSVFVVSNLSEVHRIVRFSQAYSEADIEKRWHDLLFEATTSRTAQEAIMCLPPIVKAQLDRDIPFSDVEESLLTAISYEDIFAKHADKYVVFDNLLHEKPSSFYIGRKAEDLFRQWNRLRSCRLTAVARKETAASSGDILLGNTISEPPPRDAGQTTGCRLVDIGGEADSFSDTELILTEMAETAVAGGLSHLMEASAVLRRRRMLALPTYHGFQAAVTEAVAERLLERQKEGKQAAPQMTGIGLQAPLAETPNDCLSLQRSRERYRLRRRLQSRMNRLKEEARRWTAIVESEVVTGAIVCDPQPSYPTLALLTGRKSRFLINFKKVTFGRASSVFTPDIDLSQEGEVSRVSRCHGQICLGDNGSFMLDNFSNHPVFVDGNSVLKGEKIELRNASLLSISHLCFRFDIAREYVSWLCCLNRSVPPSSEDLKCFDTLTDKEELIKVDDGHDDSNIIISTVNSN